MNYKALCGEALLDSAFLWVFWTPFLTFVVIPLMTAQVKSGICGAVSRSVWQSWYWAFTAGDRASREALESAKTASNTDDIPDIAMHPLQSTVKFNTMLLAVMWLLMVVVVSASVYTSYRLLGSQFFLALQKSALIFVAITVIEAVFFGAVVMQYNPFDQVKIIQDTVASLPNS